MSDELFEPVVAPNRGQGRARGLRLGRPAWVRHGQRAFDWPRREQDCVNRATQRLIAGLDCVDEIVAQRHDSLLHFRELVRRQARRVGEVHL
jgi:hypothetical protein